MTMEVHGDARSSSGPVDSEVDGSAGKTRSVSAAIGAFHATLITSLGRGGTPPYHEFFLSPHRFNLFAGHLVDPECCAHAVATAGVLILHNLANPKILGPNGHSIS